MKSFNRIYYDLKPYLPWKLRFAVRRRLAAGKRRRCQETWPIDETAGRMPDGWPGWPDGKRFALVLTHDLEGQAGLRRWQRLADLEVNLGFRSSFNFVPEGEYETPGEARQWLTSNGFEVGVHDLNHDGHLYRSRETFRAKAGRINHYLKDWNAVGFRSGFMHHSYDWLHDLDVLYDASSFDTDPFEPQPDGVGTIFPFWIPAPAGPEPSSRNGQAEGASLQFSGKSSLEDASARARRGYVEMPYTLPQDSTIFLLFGEKTIDIWKRKVDWIARQGGMVLVNVHPDYMAFHKGQTSEFTYPVSYYQEFLQWIQDTYQGQFWHVLPKTLATHLWAAGLPERARKPKRICMVAASVFERDNRVLRYAETLVQRGDKVDAIAMGDSDASPRRENVHGVEVLRVGTKANKGGKFLQLWAAVSFLVRSCVSLSRNHLRERYDLVHVHNMPDFLVFAAWLPKLTGAGIILDIHDIVPEFYATRFGTKPGALLPQALCWVERLCAAFSSHVIVSNHLWRDTIVSRSASPDRCSVFINSVDMRRFFQHPRSRHDDRLVIVYPGSFNWHQGLDLAIRAFARVQREIPAAELHLYGRGPAKDSLVALAGQLGLNGSVRFFEPLPLDNMPEILANADLGVVPKRASDYFGNQAFSTKIMEFMSQGLPIVASRTAVDSYYYDDSMLRFFESENVEELATALLELARDPVKRSHLIGNAHAFVARNSWETRRQAYLDLVDSLSSPRI